MRTTKLDREVICCILPKGYKARVDKVAEDMGLKPSDIYRMAVRKLLTQKERA